MDRVTTGQSNKTREGTDTQSAETTTLLSGATSLAALTATAMGTDEVRSDKIAQLRQSISNGSYQIDPSQVADAMLKEWQQRP